MEVLTDPVMLNARRTDWDTCVAATGGDIYFTVNWISIWWRHFGKGRQFLAYRLTDDAGPVGVFAFAVDTFGKYPFSVRIARLAGMDSNYAILGMPLRPDLAVEALDLVFSDLLRKRSCTGISLSPISDTTESIVAVHAAAESGGRCLVRDKARRQHTVMHLPDSKEEYWAGISKSRQKEIRRSSNKMQKSYSLSHHASGPEDMDECFDSFVSQHTRQWQALGKGGHFGDWPGSYAYYRDLVRCLSRGGHARVERHFGNDEVLSSRLTFLFGHRAYWRLTARTLNEDAVKMGVGKVGLVERVKKLIDHDVRIIEAGAGEYDYKLSYGGQLVPLRQIIISRSRRDVRLGLLLGWANLLDLFYYRIWFLKLAPRWRRLTGAKPRPLWQAWIRTRL